MNVGHLTVVNVLEVGLGMASFADRGRLDGDLNLRRFRAWYGSSPGTILNIWNDLLTTPIR